MQEDCEMAALEVLLHHYRCKVDQSTVLTLPPVLSSQVPLHLLLILLLTTVTSPDVVAVSTSTSGQLLGTRITGND